MIRKRNIQKFLAVNQLSTFLSKLLLMIFVISYVTSSLNAQGSITGQLTNANLSTPPDNEILFFGFINNTDNEIRLSSSIGAGYDTGNWYDYFPNYTSAASGQPYHFFFFNQSLSQKAILNKTISSSGFQIEDVTLATGSWPAQPTNINSSKVSSEFKIIWSMTSSLTWHIYRRVSSSDGSFFRLDNISGNRSDRGIADSFFVDNITQLGELYEYVIIAEDDLGNYSPPSEIVLLNPSSCCQGMSGNANNDIKNVVTVSDISVIIDFLFGSGIPVLCPEAAHTDGDQSGDPSVSDISWIIDHMFGSGLPLAPCPLIAN